LENKEEKPRVFDACPHCGHPLSKWEQVLLNVDHALMCKNCWYRIILDVREERKKETGDDKPKE
jgi:DNA-directed RNA polymerase subunit RPC12/RpoP